VGFNGRMPDSVRSKLEGTLEIIRIGPDGLPVVQNGHFVTDRVSFLPTAVVESLYQQSQTVPAGALIGFQIGGPGQFSINAASMDLGSSDGILSWGIGGPGQDPGRYAALTPLTPAGAEVNVTLSGDLSMFTSTIASMYGGDVNVRSTGGQLNLGSQESL